MSSLNGREVIIARLHVPTLMPVYGSIGTLVDPKTAKTGTGGLKMERTEGGIYLAGQGWSGFIPDSNIVSLVFGKENSK